MPTITLPQSRAGQLALFGVLMAVMVVVTMLSLRTGGHPAAMAPRTHYYA